jgi:short-subunit dehydrogenase
MSVFPARPNATAIVTGASSGIGRAISRLLAEKGYGVTLIARDETRLASVADELRRFGVRADVIAVDLADRTARASIADRIGELGLVPDILVNNAGFSTRGPIAECDPMRELRMIEIDVAAVADLCGRILPGMVRQNRGAILNVASTTAFHPLAGQAGYAAAKAFVLAYTRSLAAELSGTEVTASVLCPGPVDTAFTENAGFSRAEAFATLPKFMWRSAEAVALAGVEALSNGRALSIPGRPNQAAALISHLKTKQLLIEAKDADPSSSSGTDSA